MKATQEKYKRPELFLQELLRKYAKGQLLDTTSNVQPFMKAIVLAIDLDGGNLSNPDAVGSVTVGKTTFRAQVGPRNPANSIKARVISKGFDRFFTDAETRVFWPMVQNDHISVPIKPGEHVTVIFEDQHYEHGLWLFKASGHEGPNFSEGAASFSQVSQTNAMDAFERPQNDPITDTIASDSVDRPNLNELF